jgi:hypothetical protein
VDFEIAVVAVGLAREQAFELALGSLVAQFFERRLGFLDDALVAFGLAQLDELDRVAIILLDALVAADQVLEAGALAGYFLRRLGIIPESRVFDLGVQFGKAPVRDIPVKDASAARRAIFGCRRRWPGFPRASVFFLPEFLPSLRA